MLAMLLLLVFYLNIMKMAGTPLLSILKNSQPPNGIILSMIKMMAIVMSFKHWCHYLDGASDVEVFSDHQNLKSFMS
jgi:hypothetical protein